MRTDFWNKDHGNRKHCVTHANLLTAESRIRMDFENVATHDLGHRVGLADLYDAKCSEQTMYGYADYGKPRRER